MPSTGNARLHPHDPVLIPGLSDFSNWTGNTDLGTLDCKAKVYRRVEKEDITAYNARIKREKRNPNRRSRRAKRLANS